MSSKTVVIKYGGHAIEEPEIQAAFYNDLKSLTGKDFRFVITHGGGPQINELLNVLNIKSEFIDGLRVTSDKALAAVEMALCGQVNKMITRRLLKNGIMAAGISGEDGDMLTAIQKDARYGRVGDNIRVNPALLFCLMNGGFLPVVAPLALDADKDPLNVNADTSAGAIAGALHADYFILISDVPGLLDDKNNLLPEVTKKEIDKMIAGGIIHGGMLPKLESCIHALNSGCKNAIILDGRAPNSMHRFLINNEPLGTLIKME